MQNLVKANLANTSLLSDKKLNKRLLRATYLSAPNALRLSSWYKTLIKLINKQYKT